MDRQQPIRIPGAWQEGYALDYHTVGSTFLGYDQFGHPKFDTKRTILGELLYQVKFRRNSNSTKLLVKAGVSFLRRWKPPVEVIVPVPTTRHRTLQPVMEIAKEIGKALDLPVLYDVVKKNKRTPELKNVLDYSQRVILLENAFAIHPKSVRGKVILLFDDLYRSGATLNEVTRSLYKKGECKDVYALVLTMARSAL